MATDLECIEICEALCLHWRETQDDWPWEVFASFPTVVKADHYVGGIQKVLALWWFHVINDKIWGSHIYVNTELDAEDTKGVALSGMDLLAEQCRLTIKEQQKND